MLKRCGYITTVNRDNNKNDCVTVISFEGTNVYNCDRRIFSKYVFSVNDYKLIERNHNEFTNIPYSKLIELIDECILVDKQNKFYRKYAFAFDTDNKPKIFEKEIIKDVFPLPSKTMAYMKQNYYYNITKHVFGTFNTTELCASVASDLLNNIAVSNGFILERMFEYSYGRLFINVSMLSDSFEGRKILKSFIENYKDVISFCKTNIKSIKIKRYPNENNLPFENNYYSNEFIKFHNISANILKDKNIFDCLLNLKEFVTTVNKEVKNIQNHFDKVYHIFNGLMPKDLKYLSVDELFKLCVDGDFSYDIVSYVSDKRKIYNANKCKNIVCIKSDGELYCIE